MNLCMLLENIPGTRMTSELYQKWKGSSEEPLQIHIKGSLLSRIVMPELGADLEPEIFGDPVDTLKKSAIYPYGLSDPIVERLHEAGINTVRDLYDVDEASLDEIPYIGEFLVRRLKNAVAQAIWL